MVVATLDRNLWICASGKSPLSPSLPFSSTHNHTYTQPHTHKPTDGDLAGVQEFLDQGGMDVNAKDENGYTCMHAAASYGHAPLIAFLVSRGGNVNIQDPDGDTPLHVCEEAEVAQVLVSHGANAEAVNEEGKKPYEVAQEDGHWALANYLRGLCGLPTLTEAEMEAAATAAEAAEGGTTEVDLQELQALVAGAGENGGGSGEDDVQMAE